MPVNTGSRNQQVRVASLGYMEFDGAAAYRGAILVTHDWGKPLEMLLPTAVKAFALALTPPALWHKLGHGANRAWK